MAGGACLGPRPWRLAPAHGAVRGTPAKVRRGGIGRRGEDRRATVGEGINKRNEPVHISSGSAGNFRDEFDSTAAKSTS